MDLINEDFNSRGPIQEKELRIDVQNSAQNAFAPRSASFPSRRSEQEVCCASNKITANG